MKIRALRQGIRCRWTTWMAVGLVIGLSTSACGSEAAPVAADLPTVAADDPEVQARDWSDLPPGTPGTAASAEEAILGADVVIRGVVQSSGVGRTVGDPGEPGLTFIETAILVEEVLTQAGQSPSVKQGSVVLVETEATPGWVDEGAEGTEVIGLLWLKRDEESAGRYYRPITRSSLIRLDTGDGRLVVRSDVDDDVVGSELAKLGLTGIRTLADSDQ